MTRKTPMQPSQYFRMDEHLAKDLDKHITRMGYASRSEFFTAVAYTVLYGRTAEDKITDTLNDWLENAKPPLSEFEIRQNLIELVGKMLHPAIAMKGKELAFANAWETIREEFHTAHDIWLTESDIREAFNAYTLIRRKELNDYRNHILNQKEDKK